MNTSVTENSKGSKYKVKSGLRQTFNGNVEINNPKMKVQTLVSNLI